MNDLMNELEAEAEASPEKASQASLDGVHAMAVQAVGLEVQILDLEGKLSELKKQRYDLLTNKMPTDMVDTKTRILEVDGFVIECKPYYKANIAADDPEDKRERAFKWLADAGGSDIVNNVVTVAFPKERADDAAKFYEETRKRFDNQREIEVVSEKKVPWNRLTKWLREYVERKPSPDEKKLPVPLEDLNATLGMVATIKKSRD